MPHIIVKLWPDKTHQQKSDLTNASEGSSRIEIRGERLPEAILAMSETD